MTNGQKVIVACPSCAAQYNVATLAPGARFKCQKCGTINTVPAALALAPKPQQRPTVKMPAQPAATRVAAQRPKAPMPSRPLAKGMAIKPSGLKKGLPARKIAVSAGDDESMDGFVIKKKSKAPLFIGITVGVVILVVAVIALSSGGDDEAAEFAKADAARIAKEQTEAEEKAQREAEEKEAAERKTAAAESGEEKPDLELIKQPPAPKKSAKPKFNDEIDQAVKTEIEPILNDIKNQRDIDPSVEKIMAHGKKAIPVLIEAIGGEDTDAARYAYEILLKLTKRNKDDTTQVNQMLGRSMRQDCQKDWESWWYKHKDDIPE